MHPNQQPILVLSRKKPHLLFLLMLSFASGVTVFLGGAGANDEGVSKDLIESWVMVNRVWGGLLIFTGLVSFIAHVQKLDRERGMYIERGALTMQAGGVFSYGLCLPVFLGWSAGVGISLFVAGAWIWANLWEVKLIGADLKLISAARRLVPRSDDDPHPS